MADWERMIDEFGPSVWRTVFRLVGHRADAEDCFQATFVAAWRLAQREQVGNWPAALNCLATSRALECLRARIRRRKVAGPACDEAVSSKLADPAETAAGVELMERIRLGIARLPPRQAEIVCLVCINGLSNSQAAEILNLTPNRVGVELHRARQSLGHFLGTYANYGHDGKKP